MTSAAGAKRVVIVAPDGRAIARLRGALIRDLVSRDAKVLALAPDMQAQDAQALIALGAEAGGFSLKPEGFKLFPTRAAMKLLSDRIKAFGPGAVLVSGNAIAPFALKAARHAGVSKTVFLVTGSAKQTPRQALKSAGTIVAQNRDDYRVLAAQGFNGRAGALIEVAGAGADLQALDGLAIPGLDQGIVFLFAARLDRDKGAQDFCEAARLLKHDGVAAHFLAAGPGGSGVGALRPEDMSKYAGIVEFLGDVDDLKIPLARAHVFVAPSHREGLPHAVQQAMAAGRAVIVSDIPGARDTVDEVINGIRVAPGTPSALAEAMRRLVDGKNLLPALGRASRAKAERHYDVTAVNAQLRAALGVT